MLTDFNDIWWECTRLYLQTNWYIPFVIWYNICTDIMISEMSFLSNYVTRCKEERCKTNGQNIQIIH